MLAVAVRRGCNLLGNWMSTGPGTVWGFGRGSEEVRMGQHEVSGPGRKDDRGARRSPRTGSRRRAGDVSTSVSATVAGAGSCDAIGTNCGGGVDSPREGRRFVTRVVSLATGKRMAGRLRRQASRARAHRARHPRRRSAASDSAANPAQRSPPRAFKRAATPRPARHWQPSARTSKKWSTKFATSRKAYTRRC